MNLIIDSSIWIDGFNPKKQTPEKELLKQLIMLLIYIGIYEKKGITIRKSIDCLIASYAILGNMYILHYVYRYAKINKWRRIYAKVDAFCLFGNICSINIFRRIGYCKVSMFPNDDE
jgi:hypothetical protein